MSKNIQTIIGDFDYARYRRFRKAYIAAVKESKQEFVFEDSPVLVVFAVYMIEFLQPQFANK